MYPTLNVKSNYCEDSCCHVILFTSGKDFVIKYAQPDNESILRWQSTNYTQTFKISEIRGSNIVNTRFQGTALLSPKINQNRLTGDPNEDKHYKIDGLMILKGST